MEIVLMVNKVVLIGNLGADPEYRELGEDNGVVKLRIATTTKLWDKQKQERTEQTEWHNVAAFGGLAKTCDRFLSKGRQVYVEGRIQTRKWQDKEGNDKYSTEIIANEITFLGKKDDARETNGSTQKELTW
jgi:single-strand DNA-binding protein